MPREQADHSKGQLPRTQEMTLHMDITRWSILKSDRLYTLQLKMEKLYTAKLKKKKKRKKERKEKIVGADCGSEYEFLTANIEESRENL